MKILAIDPGETTGVVLMDSENLQDLRGTTTILWRNIDNILKASQPDVIVVEAFRLYRHKAQAQIGSYFPSAQVIGVVRYLAEGMSIPVVEQMASTAKWLPKSPRIHNPHLQDAWRHAEAYRRKTCLK